MKLGSTLSPVDVEGVVVIESKRVSTEPEEPEDLAGLYRRAFAEYGHALWNLARLNDQRRGRARDTQALRTHGHMEGRRFAERIEDLAVPITKFQSDVLRSLAAHRIPDSYIAGGVACRRCDSSTQVKKPVR